ncbi:hypothetical protein NUU61_004756 [Penicillium alfredii]|uniref:Uncharacterized protein n=1 Tax=Penicillium alfredii TaxID=1506179 RepID=A0A9W9K795_9EURO|nr:uncharacterized protein NUU61_004756 [Penicillium alfredii]KAJ5095400.1 hypothetical protein NUU61_004756 [Penicillium alfredii]
MKLSGVTLLCALSGLAAALPPSGTSSSVRNWQPATTIKHSPTTQPSGPPLKPHTEYVRLFKDTNHQGQGPIPCKVEVHTKFLNATSARVGHYNPQKDECEMDRPNSSTFVWSTIGAHGFVSLAYQDDNKPEWADNSGGSYVAGALYLKYNPNGDTGAWVQYTLPVGLKSDCHAFLSGGQLWTQKRCNVNLKKWPGGSDSIAVIP